MPVLCIACNKEILIGEDSIYISHGVIELSAKSHRPYHKSHEEDDPLHSKIACYLQYMASRTNSSVDELADTTIELCRKNMEPDLRIEIFDELRSNYKDELQEEVVEELGRTCTVCNEDMGTLDEAMERDRDPLMPIPQPQYPQQCAPPPQLQLQPQPPPPYPIPIPTR